MKKLKRLFIVVGGLALLVWVTLEVFAARWVRQAVTSQLQFYPSDTVHIEQINISYFPLGLEFINTSFDLNVVIDSNLVSYRGKLAEARIKGINYLEILQGKTWKVELLETQNATIDWVVEKDTAVALSGNSNNLERKQNIWLKELNFLNLDLSLKRKNLVLEFKTSLELDSVYLNRKDSIQWSVADIILRSSEGYFKELVSNYELGYQNFEYSSSTANLAIEGFYMKPTRSRSDFIMDTKYLSVLSTIDLPSLRITGIDHTRLNRGLFAKTLHLQNLKAELFEDTRKPRKPGRVPLPSESILKLPFELDIDSLIIENALVEYREKAKTENELAYLKISEIDGAVYPLSNLGHSLSADMRMDANALFMDESKLQLNARFLPNTKTHEFAVEARLGKTDVTIFNPAIAPIADISLKSGTVNNLYASFTGDDYRARGYVQMDYDDFKIALPAKGEEKSFLTKITQGLGNFAAVNNNHDFNDYAGEINYDRDPERPFINYWWIAMRGGIKDVVKVF